MEPSAIIVLVSPYQHISQAALANLNGEIWMKLFCIRCSYPCCTKDDNSWAWKSELIAINSRGRAKAQNIARKAP